MVAFGPLLAVATFAALSEMQWLGGGKMLRPVLLADFVYALVVAAFVAQRIAEMIADAAAALGGLEAAHAAGALLHRHRADPDDPGRGLRHDHAELRARGLVLRPGAQRGGQLDGRGAGLRGGASRHAADRRSGRSGISSNEQKAAESAACRRRAARPPDPRPAADAAGAAQGLHHRRRRQAARPRRAELPLLVHAAVAGGHRAGADRRGRHHPGLGEQRVLGAAAARGLPRPFPLRQPRGRRQDPEPARRDAGDGAALPAARGRPRSAALRVRAGLSRLRAGGDPGGDVDGALVRRAAGAAGRAPRRRGGAGRAWRSRRQGARGEGRRRDRAARPHLQRDDPPGEGPARRADRRQRRDRAAAAAVRFGAVGRDGGRGRPRRRADGSR